MNTKISGAQQAGLMKLAADNLRALSEENLTLREKVTHFEKKERAEKIATAMDEKGLQPDLSLQEKVANLLRRDDLGVVEEAVNLSAPQMKLASVHDDGNVVVEGGEDDHAADAFAANLFHID